MAATTTKSSARQKTVDENKLQLSKRDDEERQRRGEPWHGTRNTNFIYIHLAEKKKV